MKLNMKMIFIVNESAGRGKSKKIIPNIEKECKNQNIEFEIRYITKEKSNIKIESYTIGEVVDKGIKDASFMGAVMAPAAASVLVKHLEEMKRNVDYYDLILTGDLGCVGASILKEYLKRAYNMKMKKDLLGVP